MSLLFAVQDQFQHMECADALVWQAVFTSEASRFDDAVRARLHHIHLVQRSFLAVWRGEFTEGDESHIEAWFNRGTELQGRELMEWGRDGHREIRQFLEGVTEDALARPVMLPWERMLAASLGRNPAIPNLGETLFQVILHSMHHRGQVNTRLRELNVAPPLVDFIAWVWSGKPAAFWPEMQP